MDWQNSYRRPRAYKLVSMIFGALRYWRGADDGVEDARVVVNARAAEEDVPEDGSQGAAPAAVRIHSSAHNRAAWRYLVSELHTQRMDIARREVSKARSLGNRWAGLAKRVVKAGYWRSVGPQTAKTEPATLRESWRWSDLVPECVRKYGVGAAERVLAGRVTAAFLSLSPDEEVASDVRYHASAWDSFASWVRGDHKRRHRTTNRWVKRMAQLRVLRERLILGAEGIRRVRSPVNDAWCSIQARKLVSECVDSGDIEGRHARWYRDALVTVFYLEDDDDRFFAAVSQTPGGRVY
nr:hypothetical protein [Tolivirales sp.]